LFRKHSGDVGDMGDRFHQVANSPVRRYVEAALGGNMTAMKEIGDRLDGKPRQSMEMTTVARKPLREMTDEEITARIAELEGTADVSEEDEAESAPPVTH
jgi:hypothetical protein